MTPTDNPAYNGCTCPCHKPGSAMMHWVACCLPTDKPAPDVREAVKTILARCEALADEASDELAKDLSAHAEGYWRGQKFTAKSIRDHLHDMTRPSAEAGEVDGGFKQAVIDALVVAHIYRIEHENDPRKALNDLLAWEQSIPVGMVLVPREPTEEMLNAPWVKLADETSLRYAIWSAMIAAAPGAAK